MNLYPIMHKVYRVIDSCLDFGHLNTAKKMLQNYENLYGRSCLLSVFIKVKENQLIKN
jgi:hypothetical protein